MIVWTSKPDSSPERGHSYSWGRALFDTLGFILLMLAITYGDALRGLFQ